MEMASDSELVLYADDSIIIYADKDPKIIENKLAKDLNGVNHWLVENKLSLHPEKCEAILFGSKRKIRQVRDFAIKFDNIEIKGNTCLKYLGTSIENDMSGKECVDSIIKKANGRLKFLYRHRKVLSRDIRKILSMALVQCHIDYACMSWYYNLTKEYKHKLQVLQNKMIRFILGKSNREHVGCMEFRQCNCTNIENRVKQLSLNIVHKLFYRQLPEYLLPYFVPSSTVHTYSTRNSQFNFVIPTVRNTIVSSSFSFNAVKAWNSLPNSIKSIADYQRFKRKTKSFLINQINA
jgi:hypothetical protein